MRSGPAFLFDLDGTLVDSVYQHVLAWREALESVGIELSVWRIHRRIGMSGGLFVNALFRETGRELKPEQAAQIRRVHAEAYARQIPQVRPLPGARELLAYLTKAGVPWAIGTSGRMESAKPNLDMLAIPRGVPIVTRDQVEHAKPDPDLFLAGAERLSVPIDESIVVGDSVWDLLAARPGEPVLEVGPGLERQAAAPEPVAHPRQLRRRQPLTRSLWRRAVHLRQADDRVARHSERELGPPHAPPLEPHDHERARVQDGRESRHP